MQSGNDSVESALKKSGKMLLETLDNLLDGVFALDTEWNYSYVNKRAAELIGKSSKEIIGKNIWEEFPFLRGTPVEENYLAAMTHQTIKSFITKSIRGERWYNLTAYPTIEGLIVVWQDITERRQIEEARKLSEEQLKAIAESSIIEISVSTLDGKMLFVNDAYSEAFGYNREELIGSKTPHLYVNDKDREKLIEVIKKDGCIKNFETQVKRKDGTTFWIAASIAVIDYGGQKAVLGVSRDITQRKEAEEQLEKTKNKLEHTAVMLKEYADKMEELAEQRAGQLREAERLAGIGQTARMIGHDIRNPLQAIISDAYLLRECLTEIPNSNSKADAIESLESIENSIGYINKIVADLQDYARPLKPECAKIDFYELVTNVFHGVKIPDNIDISIDIESELTFSSDETFLRRILSNLIINAIQAMPEGGKLNFAGCKHEKTVLIFVEDTGGGIPEEVRSKLFTPMLTTKSKGQGLGLAVVKRLIDSLHGTINVESQVGVGTKFVIELPLG